MTSVSVNFFPPVARKENLNRLAALPQRAAIAPDLWSQVHDEIQAHFKNLETEVRSKVAGMRVTAHSGRTQGDKFFLFSYCTFSIPDPAFDPVVVGMTFTPANGEVLVEGDVSGEQTGDCVSSVPSNTVAISASDLLATAHESALKLCQSANAIAAALEDPSRRVE